MWRFLLTAALTLQCEQEQHGSIHLVGKKTLLREDTLKQEIKDKWKRGQLTTPIRAAPRFNHV